MYLIVESPGYELGEPVGVGGEDAEESLGLGHPHVLLLHDQGHLDVLC